VASGTPGTKHSGPMVWAARGLVALGCSAAVGWMALAIYCSPLEPPWIRAALGSVVPIGTVAALLLVRPLRRVVAGILGAFVVVLGAFLAVQRGGLAARRRHAALCRYPWGSRDRAQRPQCRVPDRNRLHRALEDRALDLSRLRSLDLFLIHWGSPLIAHTIMSWGFEGDQYLAISIETRKVKGQEYSALRGFFRQYELIYVVADERDVVRLRTNYRGEDVYVYRLDAPPAGARLLLLGYFQALNRLRERPQWYNALTHNCTTTIQGLAHPYERRSWWSWKLFLNGYLDELAYELGAIDRSQPFPVLKARSRITDRAKAANDDPRFSVRIREGLP
jgi:hypothetical protein